MSRKPKTVAEAVAYLYDALDIARRPTSWIAHALQVIEIEHERVTQERDADVLAAQLVEADARVALLQQTCWQAMKLNAQVTTKHESEPDYHDGVARLHELVCNCEAKWLLPPPPHLRAGQTDSG